MQSNPVKDVLGRADTVLCMTQFRQVSLWIDRFHPHLPQQTANSFDVIIHTQFPQFILHTQHTQGWIPGKQAVHTRHQTQILLRFTHSFVIHRTARHTQQLTLPANAQRLSGIYQSFSLVHSPVFFKLFFKKSFSTFSCPIWAYSSLVSTFSASSATAEEPENACSALSRNSRFHLEI